MYAILISFFESHNFYIYICIMAIDFNSASNFMKYECMYVSISIKDLSDLPFDEIWHKVILMHVYMRDTHKSRLMVGHNKKCLISSVFPFRNASGANQ